MEMWDLNVSTFEKIQHFKWRVLVFFLIVLQMNVQYVWLLLSIHFKYRTHGVPGGGSRDTSLCSVSPNEDSLEA